MRAIFWQRGQRVFFEVRVFNPFTKSHLTRNLTPLSRAMRTIKNYTTTSESLKSRMTPSVLSCRETERILSELALKLSDKKQIDYSIANQWLREKLSFNLLRSAVLCVKVPKQPNFSWALILAGKQSQMWLESRHVLFVIFFS